MSTQSFVNVFGIRHLSPAGAWHLRRFLDQVRPDIVLIEGLSDADELIPHITGRETLPPVAILAYTENLPVRTLVYPVASYSPEYQALRWALENRAQARFIDLPSDIFLALQEAAENREQENRPETGEPLQPPVSLYDAFARQAGETDYETWWERHFEHNLNLDTYRLAAAEFGQGLRDLGHDTLTGRAENLAREAFMRRRIQETLDEGYAPEKIAVVTGAFHAPVMTPDHPAMTDAELKKLPRISSKLTLMPYSCFRLSSRSGYGAGNHAPAYFEMMWHCLDADTPTRLPMEYLSRVGRHIRESGTSRSAAEVIEGVRLANTLAALKGGCAPALCDLRDAAITLIGHGEPAVVAEALALVEVGTAIGSLPEGVSRTSIQDDFERELKRLRLEQFRTAVRRTLELDLRENRRVKTEEAAFRDLNRSFFLHRLSVLEIGFARKQYSGQQDANWKEIWDLQWTPEAEIELVEAVLLGETVELATAYRFKTLLESCRSVADAAALVRSACECGMTEIMAQARRTLQRLASESSEFASVAGAADELGQIVRYGDVRRFDAEPLKPIIEQLFMEGALLLPGASSCDNEAAKAVLDGMARLNKLALEYDSLADEALWLRQLHAVSDADHLNPLLSGYACAILLERGRIEDDALAREVSRRLSPGIDADLGAGWFEGLTRKNRHALISRLSLWKQVDEYVASLDPEQFRRALVFLRRAFGSFSPREKQQIAENMGEIWGVGQDAAAEVIFQEISEADLKSLESLNEFDFDDI